MKPRPICSTLAILLLSIFTVAGCGGSPAQQTTAPSDTAASTAVSQTTVPTTAPTTTGDMAIPEETITATAALEQGVQTISVDLSTGYYVPNRIMVKAGVPLEITFGQGKGCVKQLVFPAFDILADMTTGPHTFKLGALKPGTYDWRCGMDMRHGVIIAE